MFFNTFKKGTVRWLTPKVRRNNAEVDASTNVNSIEQTTEGKMQPSQFY